MSDPAHRPSLPPSLSCAVHRSSDHKQGMLQRLGAGESVRVVLLSDMILLAFNMGMRLELRYEVCVMSAAGAVSMGVGKAHASRGLEGTRRHAWFVGQVLNLWL